MLVHLNVKTSQSLTVSWIFMLPHDFFTSPLSKPLSGHPQSTDVIVGCTLTGDRLFAAGWSSTAECRFSGRVKESLSHLVQDCEVYISCFDLSARVA